MRRPFIVFWVSAVLALGASALGAQAALAVDGVGNVPGCVEGGNPAPFLASEAPGGPWNRVIVDQQYWGQSWYHPGQCIAAGFNSGYAEYITFKWNPGDTVGQAVSAAESMMSNTATGKPLCQWAYIIGVGNEEGLGGESADKYAQIYNQLAPWIGAHCGWGINLYAPEITAAGAGWLSQWMADEGDAPPRLSALSVHAYPNYPGNPGAAALYNDLHKYGYYVAFSEGVCGGPDTWMQYGCLPYATAKGLGVGLALEWAG